MKKLLCVTLSIVLFPVFSCKDAAEVLTCGEEAVAGTTIRSLDDLLADNVINTNTPHFGYFDNNATNDSVIVASSVNILDVCNNNTPNIVCQMILKQQNAPIRIVSGVSVQKNAVSTQDFNIPVPLNGTVYKGIYNLDLHSLSDLPNPVTVKVANFIYIPFSGGVHTFDDSASLAGIIDSYIDEFSIGVQYQRAK
jgi:hypothetical protein